MVMFVKVKNVENARKVGKSSLCSALKNKLRNRAYRLSTLEILFPMYIRRVYDVTNCPVGSFTVQECLPYILT